MNHILRTGKDGDSSLSLFFPSGLCHYLCNHGISCEYPQMIVNHWFPRICRILLCFIWGGRGLELYSALLSFLSLFPFLPPLFSLSSFLSLFLFSLLFSFLAFLPFSLSNPFPPFSLSNLYLDS